jgi:hypothetical protein
MVDVETAIANDAEDVANIKVLDVDDGEEVLCEVSFEKETVELEALLEEMRKGFSLYG